MKQIRLDIDAGGTTYSYPDAVIIDEAVTTSERLSDGRVERGSLRIALVSPTLIGATWLGAIPAGDSEQGEETFRARVVIVGTPGGAPDVVLLSGIIRAAGIAHGRAFAEASNARRWTVEVEDDALDVLLARLEDVPASTLPGSASSASLSAEIAGQQTTVYAHRLLDLATQAAAAAGTPSAPVTLTAPAALFALRVPYTAVGAPSGWYTSVPDVVLVDHDEDRAGDARLVTLPRLSGRELIDLVAALTGATLTAAYAPYPSRGIAATLAAPRWQGTSALPVALDAVLEDYDLSVEAAAEPDLAVAYEGDLAASVGVDLVSRYAAERWCLVEKADATPAPGDPVPLVPGNASVLDLPCRLPTVPPAVSVVRTSGSGAGAYSETVRMGFAKLDEPGLYVARRDATGYAVAYAEPDSPALWWPYERYHELWAAVVLARQTSREAHLVASFTAARSQLAAAPRVGEWAVALHGLPWRVRSVEENHDEGTLAIEMERPLRAALDLLVPQRRTPVLRAYRIEEVGDGGAVTLYADASADLPAGSMPGTLEIERSLDGGATWTSHTVRVQTSDAVRFRARVVYGAGDAGPYVTTLLV